jgi:thiamine-phosphate pyrophosphorylase
LLLYYITDRTFFPGDDASRRQRLLETIRHAARCGVDFIQLREKDLASRELEALSRRAVDAVQQLRTENQELKTALLINSRTDLALACGAHGVHLRSSDLSPVDVRNIWIRSGSGDLSSRSSGRQDRVTIGVSCHTPAEVARAAAEGADFVVFGPIFGKSALPHAHPGGLDALHVACGERIPVLALGGVTLENAEACIQAGAAGVAGIRLFQQGDMERVVAALRSLKSVPNKSGPTTED